MLSLVGRPRGRAGGQATGLQPLFRQWVPAHWFPVCHIHQLSAQGFAGRSRDETHSVNLHSTSVEPKAKVTTVRYYSIEQSMFILRGHPRECKSLLFFWNLIINSDNISPTDSSNKDYWYCILVQYYFCNAVFDTDFGYWNQMCFETDNFVLSCYLYLYVLQTLFNNVLFILSMFNDRCSVHFDTVTPSEISLSAWQFL